MRLTKKNMVTLANDIRMNRTSYLMMLPYLVFFGFYVNSWGRAKMR